MLATNCTGNFKLLHINMITTHTHTPAKNNINVSHYAYAAYAANTKTKKKSVAFLFNKRVGILICALKSLCPGGSGTNSYVVYRFLITLFIRLPAAEHKNKSST